jgi:hypothetical protein
MLEKKLKMKNRNKKNSKRKNLSVLNVLQSEFKEEQSYAKSMEPIISNSNASFVAISPNGFAGETLIFVNLVINDKTLETMYQKLRGAICRNALESRSAH